MGIIPPRVKGLEKIGIFDGTKVMTVRKENLEGKYKDSVVKILEEKEEEYNGVKVPMVKAKINMYKLKGADDVYFWLGTDSIGRDMWTRLWRGSRVSLMIGIFAVLINMLIGVVYGSISGYYGGWVDMIMQKL